MNENLEATRENRPGKADPMVFLFFLICLGSAVVLLTTNKIGLWLLLAVSAGLAFRGLSTSPGSRNFRWLVFVAVLIPVCFWSQRIAREHWQVQRDETLIATLVTKEELILDLTQKLKTMSDGLLNLKLPAPASLDQFDDSVSVVDLIPTPPTPTETMEGLAFVTTQFPVLKTAETIPTDQLDLWRPLLGQISYFENAKIYLIKGHFTDESLQRFEGELGFAALARMKSGDWGGLSGHLHLQWKRQDNPGAADAVSQWRIDHWETLDMDVISSPDILFVESLNQALPNPGDLQRARESLHQKAAIAYYQSGATNLPHRYFAPISANQKPGISVVDVDGDGFDDLYITVRLGKNQLLHNQGNGTFVEAAAQFGLDIPGHTTSALFADFDNDGDPDALLGRSIERSLYLENIGGKFEPRPVGVNLPYLAISLAAADYNGDGLLDVYISTYRPAVLASAGKSGGDEQQMSRWPDELLDAETSREYYRRHYEANSGNSSQFQNFLNQIGPPNVLLVNRGGGQFAIAPENAPLEVWRNTLQATWADFDEDGDPDVYVANDWAPDHLFRNDGTNGFTDITKSAGFDRFGFAMGVTWGDYDNDGKLDVYISNMYSKAGRRITSDIEGLNPEFAESADGNYLYRQVEGGRFELVSGHEPPALTVAAAGWSWGGQFADFDNDCYQDLYVLAGYFTAPKSVASDVDL